MLKSSEVENYVASQGRELFFPAAIEASYQKQRRTYRARGMRSGILPAILCYNSFLVADFYILPDTAWLATALHAVVTTWIVVAGRLLRTEPRTVVRELIAISIPLFMIGQILTISALNRTDGVGDYHFFAIVVLIYMNVNLRPDFLYAVAASLLVGAVYTVVLMIGPVPATGEIAGSASIAATIYLTLTANWRMERDARHVFLRRLLDQLRRAEAEAEAGRDALTGLLNRRELNSRAARLWSDPDETGSHAVLMIDVDHFKLFNDRYGHPAGDTCLKRVAGAIQSELRDAITARFGGEEFLALVPLTDITAAAQAAERVRRAVEDLAIPNEGAVGGRVTVSIGVAAGPVSAHSLAELVSTADTALYAAKRSGRNRIWPPFVRKGGAPVPLKEGAERRIVA